MTQHPRQLQTRARLHAIVFTLAVFFLMLTATGCEHTHPLAEHEHHHIHQHEHTQEPLAEVLRKKAEALHRELVGKHRLESLEKVARRGGVEQRRLSLSDQMPEF